MQESETLNDVRKERTEPVRWYAIGSVDNILDAGESIPRHFTDYNGKLWKDEH